MALTVTIYTITEIYLHTDNLVIFIASNFFE